MPTGLGEVGYLRNPRSSDCIFLRLLVMFLYYRTRHYYGPPLDI
jgi:hypothetical protein